MPEVTTTTRYPVTGTAITFSTSASPEIPSFAFTPEGHVIIPRCCPSPVPEAGVRNVEDGVMIVDMYCMDCDTTYGSFTWSAA